MMRRKLLLTAALALLSAGFNTLLPQYYNTGQSPASLHYRTFGNDSLRMVYPAEFADQARRTFLYMEEMTPYISYGFTHPPLRKVPVVFYTENFFSNGLSIMAPKRIEMGGIPSIDTYAEPWLKQLAAHEYRHMVQFGNLNRSTVRVLGWLLGQQANLLAAGLLPFWFIEGDAVMAETQMSQFGRALQPSFTMHYRALGREILDSQNPDKWFCGSYRDYVPDHYALGFQLVAHADRKYERYIGDAIAEYSAKYPILLFTTDIALRKYFNTSTRQMFRETFAELNDLWDALPEAEQSPRNVSAPVEVYTSYSYPVYLDERRLLVLKEDIDNATHFVEIDLASGTERTVCHTGLVSTRPVCRDGIIAWTEYRQSMFWSQKVDSRLCVMHCGDDVYECVGGAGESSVLYPAIVDRNRIAVIKYLYDGHYAFEYTTPQGVLRHDFPAAVEIHGLAWDDATECFYCIALSDEGMWIEGIDPSEPAAVTTFGVTAPSLVTINNLSAADGMLYFDSIYSGKDEAHTIDLATGRQYRISNSAYGTFAPSPSPSGEFVAVSTYSRMGYAAALQEVEYWDEIKPAPLPRNVVNAPLKPWEVITMDDITATDADISAAQTALPEKHYRRGLHAFDLHSWAPVYFKPDEILAGDTPEVKFGATLVSQNLLSSAESSLGYGYSLNGSSVVRGAFRYYGWAPKIEVIATWSDAPHLTFAFKPNNIIYSFSGQTFNLSTRAYMPMVLSSGHTVKVFTPSVQYNFNNRELYDIAANHRERSQLMVASLQYHCYERGSQLDLQTPFGYFLRANLAGNPFSRYFSTSWSLYGRLSLPGVLPHNGISLAATYQNNSDAMQIISVLEFKPHGYENLSAKHYWAASANYLMPLAYPDRGVSGVFFLKRITLNLAFEYAGYRNNFYGNASAAQHIYSVGAVVGLDVAPLRMPSQGTCTVNLGIYKPRDQKPYVTFGVSVPL